jgi:hypothetical protein
MDQVLAQQRPMRLTGGLLAGQVMDQVLRQYGPALAQQGPMFQDQVARQYRMGRHLPLVRYTGLLDQVGSEHRTRLAH